MFDCIQSIDLLAYSSILNISVVFYGIHSYYAMIFGPGFNMNPVNLLSKVILDAMFEKVGLPAAAYSARAVHLGCVEVTVGFHPISSELERPVSQTYISSFAFTDLEEAQNHVARKAMEFMEKEHNVVPSDYSYNKLQSARLNNESLRQRLKEKDRSIESLKKVNTSLVQQLEEKNNILTLL